MNFVVTTAQHPTEKEIRWAEKWAQILRVPFVPRDNQSLVLIKNRYAVGIILIAAKNGPVVHTAGGDFFFHLSMAELRIKNIISGKHDHMVAAMGLEPGMSVLDCTLGLASDAIVTSLIVGSSGTVVGLEAAPLIALITQYGLQHFVCEEQSIQEALQRIEVENIEYSDYLAALPAKSMDIVYFDPMFRQPIQSSSNLKPIRYLADNRPLNEQVLKDACRVAKKKVVVKEAHDSSEFKRLGIHNILGGKYSSVSYGVIDVQGNKAGADK